MLIHNEEKKPIKPTDLSGVNMENNPLITRRLLRLAGLVGDGLGDFPERGVDS